MTINFDGRVAIVTGAGQGLGRAYALALAARGAKVVLNDISTSRGFSEKIEAVASEINGKGGEAYAICADVAEFEQVSALTQETMNKWGRVDILVNNAGILRDKSFLKMSIEDFKRVIDVHLIGTANCTKTVWEIMRNQAYGRIVMTTSSSGLYGNFGQANYGAAKMAMVGMMNTLHIEGAKHNIRVNCLAPTAGTEMTDGLLPVDVFKLLSPESVSHGVVFLASENAPSRTVLCAGGGSFSVFKGYETKGTNLLPGQLTPEGVAKSWDDITNEKAMSELQSGIEQTTKFARQAAKSLNIELS